MKKKLKVQSLSKIINNCVATAERLQFFLQTDANEMPSERKVKISENNVKTTKSN